MNKNIKSIITNRRFRILIVISFLHSIFLIFGTLWLLDKNIIYGDEKFLIKWSTIIEKIIFKIDKKPPQNDLLFINCSYDNMLVDRFDNDGFPVGNQRITDRKQITELFRLIYQRKSTPKFVLCDIFFQDSSSADTELKTYIENIGNIVIPYHLDRKGMVLKPVFNCSTGLADYSILDGSFIKFRLIYNDTIKSVPLVMYNKLYNKHLNKHWIFYFNEYNLSLNNIIVDYKVRSFDIEPDDNPKSYPVVNLGEFLLLPEQTINSMMQDKIVLIGDLRENDIHSTALGNMPGVLILLNSFLTLSYGENNIYPVMIVFLFVGYFLISLDIFSAKNLKERDFIKKVSAYKIGDFILKYFGYLLYLGFISIILYVLYNIHINILIITVYLKTLESLINHFRMKAEEKKGLYYKIFGLKDLFLKSLKSD